MTEQPGKPLNLIERMAKRQAAEEAAATRAAAPTTAGLVERAAEKMASMPAVSNGFDETRDSEKTQLHEQTKVPSQAAPARAPAGETVPPVANALAIPKQVRIDFRALRQNGMITPDNMTSPISNEFRSIKRKLLQKVRDPKTRTAVNNLIMITSSLPGEGKTFSSINLALSLVAERGLQVLLIDADIIRPSIGNMFLSSPREGLTEYLSGKVSKVSDVLHRCVEIPNLAIIFSGDPKSGSPELISSAQMATLCKELSSRYPDRVIVIDTPPVLASSEAAILASIVHQVIVVVSADQTDKHQLRESLEAVSACRSINLLFNKAPNWNAAEYNSYYGYANPPGASATQA
jgi:protein-tyrosine kinase